MLQLPSDNAEKERLLKSLVAVRQSPLKKFLEQELTQLDKKLRRPQDTILHVQGQAQMIEALLDVIEKSPQLLKEAEGSRR